MAGQFILIIVFGVVTKRIHGRDVHGFDIGRECTTQAVSDHGCSVANVQTCDVTTYGCYATSGKRYAQGADWLECFFWIQHIHAKPCGRTLCQHCVDLAVAHPRPSLFDCGSSGLSTSGCRTQLTEINGLLLCAVVVVYCRGQIHVAIWAPHKHNTIATTFGTGIQGFFYVYALIYERIDHCTITGHILVFLGMYQDLCTS